MFTVIIPLYNKSPYIEKALLSVRDQTYQDFELIIIDDGSMDKGFEVVQNLFSKFSPPSGGWEAVQQANQGVSVARNNGVKMAKYDYIAFLDADDWWEPTFLEEMKCLIEKYPDASIYGSSYYKVKNGQLIRANIGVEMDFEHGLINYCQVYAKTMYMPLTSITSVIKRSVFESEYGFNPILKMGEDFDLWIRVAMKHPVAFLNKPLAYYNQDVELANRAIGTKLYEPHEHMLFTDYGQLNKNQDFRKLYEVLAVYGLLPYYLAEKNKKEVSDILSEINWKNHAFKYQLYYKILPKWMVNLWLKALKIAATYKAKTV